MAGKPVVSPDCSVSKSCKVKEGGTYAQAVANIRTLKKQEEQPVSTSIKDQTVTSPQVHHTEESNHSSNIVEHCIEKTSADTIDDAIDNHKCLQSPDHLVAKQKKPQKFIDAPPPKVNPWVVRKNAAQIIAGQETLNSPAPEFSKETDCADPASHTKRASLKDEKKPQKMSDDTADSFDWPSLAQVSQEHKNGKKANPPANESLEFANKSKNKDVLLPNTPSDRTVEKEFATSDNLFSKKKGFKHKWVPFGFELSSVEGKKKSDPTTDKHPTYTVTKDKIEVQVAKDDESLPSTESCPTEETPAKSGSSSQKKDFNTCRRGRSNRGKRGRSRTGYYSRNRAYRDFPNTSFIPSYGPSYNMPTYPTINPTFYMPSTISYYAGMPTSEAVRRQIEFYFSDENLIRDVFMRRKMDSEGYLPLTLIATFNNIRMMTLDMNIIIQAAVESNVVEFDPLSLKIRRKQRPEIWPLVDPPVDASADVPAGVSACASNDISANSTVDIPVDVKFITSDLHPDVPDFVPGKPYICVAEKISKCSTSKTTKVTDKETSATIPHYTNEDDEQQNFMTEEMNAMKISNNDCCDSTYLSKSVDAVEGKQCFEKADIGSENLSFRDKITGTEGQTGSTSNEDDQKELKLMQSEHLNNVVSNGTDTSFTDRSCSDSDQEFNDPRVNNIIVVVQPPAEKCDSAYKTGERITHGKMIQNLEVTINELCHGHTEEQLQDLMEPLALKNEKADKDTKVFLEDSMCDVSNKLNLSKCIAGHTVQTPVDENCDSIENKMRTSVNLVSCDSPPKSVNTSLGSDPLNCKNINVLSTTAQRSSNSTRPPKETKLSKC